jgi:hypothetical protein
MIYAICYLPDMNKPFPATIHATKHLETTFCGKLIIDSWWIMGTCEDHKIEITCKKCKEKMAEVENG